MKSWLRGRLGGLGAFVVIAALVAGGLGWATAAALRLEREQRDQRAEAEHASLLRLALWRLDSLIASALAREDGRPFDHYSALFAPPHALGPGSQRLPAGSVLEPSPLLGDELPGWMRLHFQVSAAGWASPQVPSPALGRWLRDPRGQVPLGNVTAARRRLLGELARDLPAGTMLAEARRHAGPTPVRDRTLLVACRQAEEVDFNQFPTQQAKNSLEYLRRSGGRSTLASFNANRNPQVYDRNVAINNTTGNGDNWVTQGRQLPPSAEVAVRMSPMVGLWLPRRSGDQLVVLRLVRFEQQEVCQGIVLDAPALERLLAEEVQDLFPGARVQRAREPAPERTMTALPLQLDPSPSDPPAPVGPTPLRLGLVLAWTAALVALLGTALVGWSLLTLSERRIRFVWAVTHELRSPLTTLRLYLDMLVGGLVRDEAGRADYLRTLHAEAERLHRLVSNVLDFSRLEGQRARPARERLSVADLLARLAETWATRCSDAGKELVVAGPAAAGAVLWTDAALLEQVLGNLIDNACKYSREAQDRRIWLRYRTEGGRAVLEVEDRGPGVAPRQRRAIFRPFRRGQGPDVSAGGVGLGLALARRWARLLGGRLTLTAPAEGGACFRLELPPPAAEPAETSA
jgi:signal transduction histidine kinase